MLWIARKRRYTSKIAEKAMHLRELSMSDKAIAWTLGVSDKTVAKAMERARNG